ncbi:hypothetical protein ACP275_11G045900 [Erythranthe tilingii]
MGSRVKEDEKNERIIRNLLKIPENRRCINCNSLGPQYVCTNFSSFVCTTCSGIHREFTHRVKSVSMAKFTTQEVSALQGGGNASAREIYLKEWDPQRNSVPDGSNVERLRDFIKHVYVDKRYTGERNLEKPLKERMGETEDFRGNRRADTYQGGSRSPPYDDSFERRQSDRASPGGRSPPYDQDNRKNSDYKKSPARAEVVNDWRREDRFGNGRRSGDRSSDGGSKFEIGSPDSQKDSDVSSPPIVRPVRDILGDNVSPLRVIEPPPRATSGKSNDGWATQRTASSSSLASSEATNPSEVKVEASFIDFDSVPEPPTVPPPQQVATDASVHLTTSNNNDWANFDAVPEVKTYNAPSNSLESLFSGLSIPAPTSSGNTALPAVLPPVSASAASHLDNIGGNVLTQAPTGGQWPNMVAEQHLVFPGGIGQPVSQPVAPVIGGFSGNQQWNSIPPHNAHGPPGASIAPMVRTEIKPAMGTSYGSTTESSLDAKSGGRQALPEDLFAPNYSYTPSPAPGWYSGSPYGAGVPVQYNNPMGSWAAPNYPPASRSTNPFDVGNDPSPLQTSTFPSAASMQEALPRTANPSGLLRTASLGTPQPHPPSMFTQAPAYASTVAPGSFAGQEITGSMPPRQQGLSGFGFDESAFASMNPNPHLGGLHHAHSASNFTSASGNPFG